MQHGNDCRWDTDIFSFDGNRIQQIRSLMNSLGLTVTDVQKYMGFATPQAVYHWMNGRSLPKAYAKYLQMCEKVACEETRTGQNCFIIDPT